MTLPATIPFPGNGEPDDPRGQWTLRQLYENHTRPKVLDGRELHPATYAMHEWALCRWEELTDDPPLREIQTTTLKAFVDALRS